MASLRNWDVIFVYILETRKGEKGNEEKKKECGINLENGLSKERDWQGKRWAF